MKCCLCEGEIKPDVNGWDQGNNALPLKEGRCCNACNREKVVPERIRRLQGRYDLESTE